MVEKGILDIKDQPETFAWGHRLVTTIIKIFAARVRLKCMYTNRGVHIPLYFNAQVRIFVRARVNIRVTFMHYTFALSYAEQMLHPQVL